MNEVDQVEQDPEAEEDGRRDCAAFAQHPRGRNYQEADPKVCKDTSDVGLAEAGMALMQCDRPQDERQSGTDERENQEEDRPRVLPIGGGNLIA
ncbi:MAG: hypothetical protein QM784_04650 [Polyangiaceae bacterium]